MEPMIGYICVLMKNCGNATALTSIDAVDRSPDGYRPTLTGVL